MEEKFSNSIEYKMFQHALHLAKYDSSYDTRDRARMFSVLLSSVDRAQLASLFLQVLNQFHLLNRMPQMILGLEPLMITLKFVIGVIKINYHQSLLELNSPYKLIN